MFNDLFWALYWIDILNALGSNILVAVFISCCIWGIYALISNIEGYKRKIKLCIAIWTVPLLLLLFISFIPSKSTMYMMLGVKTTDNIVNSETGQKLQKIINSEIDNYLKKFEQNK